MLGRSFLFFLCIYASPIIPIDTFAFNGQREGFLLGLGTGGGYSTNRQNIGTASSQRSQDITFATNFIIGYAPNNRVLIHYMGKRTIYRDQGFWVSHGTAILGLTYFFRDQAPSAFIVAGLGRSGWGTLSSEDLKTKTGSGIVLGTGYEVFKNWSIEGNIAWGTPKDTKVFSFMILLSHLWY